MSAKSQFSFLLGHNKTSFGISHAQAHVHFQGVLDVYIYISTSVYTSLNCMYRI